MVSARRPSSRSARSAIASMRANSPRLRSLLPAGLRWRLTAWVAGVMVVFAAAVFVVVYESTGSQLRTQIDRDLSGDAAQLSQSLSPLTGRSSAVVSAAATQYVHAQPYRATSTLLFVLVPGEPTVTNHPEVFGAPSVERGETDAEQASEEQEARALLVTRLGYSIAQVPDVGRFRVLERSVDLGGIRVV